jgi:hypothetical protein
MKGIMAKARCEEIIIDQYLKGNIGNEFKEFLLGRVAISEDEKLFSGEGNVLKILEEDPKNFLKWLETMFMSILDSISSGICTEEGIISAFKDRIEELEHELSK